MALKLNAVTRIFVVIIAAGTLMLGACGTLTSSGELVRQEPQKTVYKSAEEPESDQATVAPTQKVPGE